MVLIRSPVRAFLVADGAGEHDRFAGTITLPAEGFEPGAAENVCWEPDWCGSDCGTAWGDDAGVDAGLTCAEGARTLPGTKSKTWWVGRHCSDGTSGVVRPLSLEHLAGCRGVHRALSTSARRQLIARRGCRAR